MIKVLVSGIFDILHPGHIYFLKSAKSYGDELHVIIGRDINIKHKKKPIIKEDQRLLMISEIKCVDYVHLGDEKNYLQPVKLINPNIIVLGFDQEFDEKKLYLDIKKIGIDAKIIRLNQLKSELYNTQSIISKIIEERK